MFKLASKLHSLQMIIISELSLVSVRYLLQIVNNDVHLTVQGVSIIYFIIIQLLYNLLHNL